MDILCFSCFSFMNLFLYQVVKFRCRCVWWPHATAGDIPCWQCVFFPLTYCFWMFFFLAFCILLLYFLVWHIVFGYFFSWFGILLLFFLIWRIVFGDFLFLLIWLIVYLWCTFGFGNFIFLDFHQILTWSNWRCQLNAWRYRDGNHSWLLSQLDN